MAENTQYKDLKMELPPRKKSGGGKKAVLLVVWVVLLGGLIFWIKTMSGGGPINPIQPPPPTPAPKLDTAMLEAKWPQIVAQAPAPARGTANTPYTIAEFGDFQCPQCGKVYPLLETLLKQYPDKVNLLFLHRPFPNLHQWAVPAGQASEIAAESGKFWPMYDVLYTSQDNLEPGYYSDYAARIGLDKAKFKAAFDRGQGLDKIHAASAFADMLGVQSTPTILLRDNVKKTVTIYVGTVGTKNADDSPQYPGAQSLLASPPWAK